jgi:hypothetical protein
MPNSTASESIFDSYTPKAKKGITTAASLQKKKHRPGESDAFSICFYPLYIISPETVTSNMI